MVKTAAQLGREENKWVILRKILEVMDFLVGRLINVISGNNLAKKERLLN